MESLITVLHIVVCVFLIIVVLLQPGKGGDIGAAFGGGGSQSVFGARGATTFLQKLTSYAAVLYLVTTITLAWYSNDDMGGDSVITEDSLKELEKEAPKPDQEAPAAPQEDPHEGASVGTAPVNAKLGSEPILDGPTKPVPNAEGGLPAASVPIGIEPAVPKPGESSAPRPVEK